MQLCELQDAARRGWQVVGEYVDHASGAKESRPALNRLMTDARRRKFDVVAVWKIDRFGRSLKHLVNALADLEAIGVGDCGAGYLSRSLVEISAAILNWCVRWRIKSLNGISCSIHSVLICNAYFGGTEKCAFSWSRTKTRSPDLW